MSRRAGHPQETPYEPFRLMPCGDELLLETRLDGRWMPVYRFSREAQPDVDYDPANWFTSTHLHSHFRHDLAVARMTRRAHYTLLHNRLTVRTPDGATQRRILDADQIEQALADTFGLPVEPDWRQTIERAGQPLCLRLGSRFKHKV